MVRSINVEPEDEKYKISIKKIRKTPTIAVFYMPGCIQMLKEPWGNFEKSMITIMKIRYLLGFIKMLNINYLIKSKISLRRIPYNNRI